MPASARHCAVGEHQCVRPEFYPAVVILVGQARRTHEMKKVIQ